VRRCPTSYKMITAPSSRSFSIPLTQTGTALMSMCGTRAVSLSEKLALVEFERCLCTKMGTPNDEVLHGHRLHGKGLAGYEAMAVENSTWLKELEKINSVHDAYKPESWRGLKHYILPFHDSTFECVARGFNVETFQTPLSDLLSDVCKRLVQEHR
jgi:hypothetical protein